jgi:hypothetical protein
MRCANADNIVYIKFEKLSDPDIAFPETLHEKNPNQSTSKEVQSRINPKSTEKRANIR